MNLTKLFAGCVMTCAALALQAQSPYAGQQDSGIKALTSAEQSALLEGQGMGLAKAAELNGYPGPRHVLDLAKPLALTGSQQGATQALFERMQTDARKTGADLLAAERVLDALYATRAATQESVAGALSSIEGLRARLRGIHLNAHLEQAALLTSQQIALYSSLGGYRAGETHPPLHQGIESPCAHMYDLYSATRTIPPGRCAPGLCGVNSHPFRERRWSLARTGSATSHNRQGPCLVDGPITTGIHAITEYLA